MITIVMLYIKFCDYVLLTLILIDTLTFTCRVTGGVSTVWEGTAFMCASTDDEIIFIHSRFINEPSRTCNNGSIVGEIVEVNGNNYTSQLNISFDPSLIGKTVTCVKDNGRNTSIVANYIITTDIGMILKCNNHGQQYGIYIYH